MIFSTNKVIKFLILSDLAFWTGWGLINPVFAIFIVERIEGGSPFVVGIAAAVFWLARSLLRTPFGILVDALPGERDDYFLLVLGFFIASLAPLGFIFAKTSWQVYLLQALHGMAMAMAYAGWMALFTKHIDKGKESTEWGLNATAVGLATGIGGAVGGWAIVRFGFNIVFVAVSVLGFLATLILLVLRNTIKGVFDNGFSHSLKGIFQRERAELSQH